MCYYTFLQKLYIRKNVLMVINYYYCMYDNIILVKSILYIS